MHGQDNFPRNSDIFLMYELGCITRVLVYDVCFSSDQKYCRGFFFFFFGHLGTIAFSAWFGMRGSRETADLKHSGPQMFIGC